MGAFTLALIFGKIIQLTHRFDYPLFLLSAVLFAGCLLWLAIRPDLPIPEPGAETGSKSLSGITGSG